MTVGSDAPIPIRSEQTELDRRAIKMAGHLLMGGVWGERQLLLAQRLLGSHFWRRELPGERSTMVQQRTAEL